MHNIKDFASKKNVGIFSILVILGAVVALSIIFQEKEEVALIEKGDEPCITLEAEGRQEYEVYSDRPSNLQIVWMEVDPIDVKEGEMQKITVKVQDANNDSITGESGVEATILTDNRSTAIAASAFKFTKAEDVGKGLLTTWEGYWTRDDSICRNYMETITAHNSKGEKTKIDISFK